MRFPVFWLALAYATGLAAFYEVDDSPRVLFLLAGAALLVGFEALGRGGRRAPLISALVGFFFAGGTTIGLTAAAVPLTRADRLLEARAGALDLSEAVRLTGWVRRAPQETLTATVYELELESVEQGGRRYAASGGARLSYFKSGEPGLPPEPVPNLRYGERVEVLARVHAPLNHQNAGSFDWRAYLARRDIFLEGSLASYLLVEKLPGLRGNRLIGWTQALRTRLLQRLEALVPPAFQPDRHAVLRAMLLGDAGFLTPAEKERFRFSGAYHVLVVSGLHVGMIALVLFWLLRRLTRSEWATTLVTIPALVFYLLLVDDRPPIERAVWMVSFYLLARLLYRRVHLANPVALAPLAVLFLHPLWLFEPSFHLSFRAVFFIAFFPLPWVERTSKPYREALGFLDAEERDELLRPPHLAQFRLDLRLLAAPLAGLVVGPPRHGPPPRLRGHPRPALPLLRRAAAPALAAPALPRRPGPARRARGPRALAALGGGPAGRAHPGGSHVSFRAAGRRSRPRSHRARRRPGRRPPGYLPQPRDLAGRRRARPHRNPPRVVCRRSSG